MEREHEVAALALHSDGPDWHSLPLGTMELAEWRRRQLNATAKHGETSFPHQGGAESDAVEGVMQNFAPDLESVIADNAATK